jgi:hypothetical protein
MIGDEKHRFTGFERVMSDNQLVFRQCAALLRKPLLSKDKLFVRSLQQQIIRNPRTFRLSERQKVWLDYVLRRSKQIETEEVENANG